MQNIVHRHVTSFDPHMHLYLILASSSSSTISGYFIVANRLYLHHISLDGSRSKVAVSGLSHALGVDFHFRNNSLYWCDSSQHAIMESTLEGLKKNVILDYGLNQPGKYIWQII